MSIAKRNCRNFLALAVLRSRTEAVEPEQALKPAPEAAKTLAKDWSKHGLDYVTKTAVEAIAAGQDLGKIARRIDGKGVVIFSLESGGSIRDTGKELFFSEGPRSSRALRRKK